MPAVSISVMIGAIVTYLGNSSNGEPIRTKEVLKRYEKSVKEFEAGNSITIEELEAKDFRELAQQQFLKGYSETDAIYDDM